ncbi:ABC-type branched-subunit amino acid transport system ATPase component [Bradyrhizobium sp. GM7.3]
MVPALLEVDRLVSGYGKVPVLEELSLCAAAGSIVSVLGPNGAGKSTLLNALGGILRSTGSVRFDGEDTVAARDAKAGQLHLDRSAVEIY